MKIFRLVLLALAIALLGVNLWALNYNELMSTQNIWIYVRILCSIAFIILLVVLIRKSNKTVIKK